MNESAHVESAHVLPDAIPDYEPLIGSLRAAGAHRFDPVRWHYIETLAERIAAYKGSTKRMLALKLAQALMMFKKRFEQTRAEANDMLTRTAQQFPQAASDLERLLAAGDFKELHRSVVKLQNSVQGASLGALVRQLEQQPSQNGDARIEGITGPRAELKTIRNFRKTWSKLSVDKQIAQALEQAPKNAGPINSHMLVLRSLALMRDISPDYLNRFMTYADTLLCLEQAEKDKVDKTKKQQVRKKAKK